MYEYGPTIASLWPTVKGPPNPLQNPHRLRSRSFSPVEFITQYPEYVAPDPAMDFVSDNGGEDHNLCTCTSTPPSLQSQTLILR